MEEKDGIEIPIQIHCKCLALEYGLPEWAIKAVEMQKIRILENDKSKPDWFQKELAKQKEKYKLKEFSFSVSSFIKRQK